MSEGVLQWAAEVVLGLQAAPGRGSSLLEVTLKVKLCFSPNMKDMPGDWTKCGLACVTFSVGLCLACPSLVHRGRAVASSVITQFLTLCLVNGEGSFLICWSTRTGLCSRPHGVRLVNPKVWECWLLYSHMPLGAWQQWHCPSSGVLGVKGRECCSQNYWPILESHVSCVCLHGWS